MTELIIRTYNKVEIPQRPQDGYFDAQLMCRSCPPKRLDNYFANKATQEFLASLSATTKLPVRAIPGSPGIALIDAVKGGTGEQGTWVHPQVAMHLAAWLSPIFAVQVSTWVLELLTKGHVAIDVPAEIRDLPVVQRFEEMQQTSRHAFFASVVAAKKAEESKATALEARMLAIEAQKTVERVEDKIDRRREKLGVGAFLRFFRINLPENKLGGYGSALTRLAEESGRKGEIEGLENSSYGKINIYPPDLLCAYFHGKTVDGRLLDTSDFEERRRKVCDNPYGDSLLDDRAAR